jgi:hypothetical protein
MSGCEYVFYDKEKKCLVTCNDIKYQSIRGTKYSLKQKRNIQGTVCLCKYHYENYLEIRHK